MFKVKDFLELMTRDPEVALYVSHVHFIFRGSYKTAWEGRVCDAPENVSLPNGEVFCLHEWSIVSITPYDRDEEDMSLPDYNKPLLVTIF